MKSIFLVTCLRPSVGLGYVHMPIILKYLSKSIMCLTIPYHNVWVIEGKCFELGKVLWSSASLYAMDNLCHLIPLFPSHDISFDSLIKVTCSLHLRESILVRPCTTILYLLSLLWYIQQPTHQAILVSGFSLLSWWHFPHLWRLLISILNKLNWHSMWHIDPTSKNVITMSYIDYITCNELMSHIWIKDKSLWWGDHQHFINTVHTNSL